MRIAALSVVSVGLLATSSMAHADNGASFDFGYVRNRVAVTDNTTVAGDAARFAIRLARGKYFHWGAEAEEARLSGSTSLPNGVVARTSGETTGPISDASPLDGNMLGLKLFAGAHTHAGRFMFGGDMALGVRDTWVSSDLGPDIAGRKGETALEARVRTDYFLSDSITIGVAASSDVLERRDVSLGAILSLYCGR